MCHKVAVQFLVVQAPVQSWTGASALFNANGQQFTKGAINACMKQCLSVQSCTILADCTTFKDIFTAQA
jgi:hypothetical protein